MIKRRVLVILGSLIIFIGGVIIFSNRNVEHENMFTRMIVLTDSKSSNYISNDLKVIEKSVSEISNDEDVINIEEAGTDNNDEVDVVEEVVEEVLDPIVYDGLTLTELANKLDRSLKNELFGKGYLYASYSLEKGVDPYLAVAISLEETGCNYQCSSLVKSCNNVGGMKGAGCGAYGAWPTLDDGIRSFIDNIYKNYVAYGLTTANTMNSKYAENPAWATNVNRYINIIRNS